MLAGTYLVGIEPANGYLEPALQPVGVVPGSNGIVYFWVEPLAPNTEAGQNIEVDDTESGVSLTFDNVTQPGVTTVTVMSEAPALPDGFSLDGAIFFDISTTSIFDGSIVICLPYVPSAFANPEALALLHYEWDSWQNVTLSNDHFTGVICGSVTSLSPFAIVQAEAPEPEPMVITGFFAPVDMGDGVVNTVKGGSTVPLKFEVHQDGIELTDTAVIASFTVSQTSCQAGAVEETVEVTTFGGTSLKYSGGEFIQNWKTPKTKGCFKVVVTPVDGEPVEAHFKLK